MPNFREIMVCTFRIMLTTDLPFYYYYVDIAHEVLVENTAEITSFFSGDYNTIAVKLRQKKIISEEVYRSVNDTCCRLSQIERMDLLLNQIKNAVKLDGSVFKLFLDILQEIDTLLASKFAAKLLESYDHKE